MKSPSPITLLLLFVTIQTPGARGLDDHFPGLGRPNYRTDRAKALRHAKVNPNQPNVVTVPHWSGSYTYQKLTYNYTMVGTDPKRGSATTRIPTVLIPIRFVFEDDGTVMDTSTDLIEGRTAIEGIVNSPIFKPYHFKIDGTSVGNTQFGDAFQRAEFWDSVSTNACDYHVVLEPPVVTPAYEVRIPAGGYHQYYVETNGRRLEFISPEFLYNATLAAINHANVSPRSLPIVIWGNVAPDTVFGPGTMRGFHGAYAVPGGVQTFVAAGYHPTTFLLEGVGNLYEGNEDINSLCRAIVSWLNDPFRNNYTPGWNRPGNTYNETCESGEDLLEVDAVNIGFNLLVAGTPLGTLNTESGTYHVADAAFLDYFTRAPQSRSVNRQYGFFSPGVISAFNGGNFPSPGCTGHIEVVNQRTVEFPNASRTQAFGINNKNWIVGDFRDAQNFRHGFLYDGQTFTRLDYPGSISTVACKINDNGRLVGFYTDAAGLPHGYSYSQGKFTPIDFPGSIDHTTMTRGINSRGDIVGLYDATAEITHGFIYQNGTYRTFDTPFGSQTEVLGINDQGDVAGFAYDIGDFLELTGFSSSAASLTRFNFPGTGLTFPWAINNLGMLAGTTSSGRFDGVDGLSGFVTIYGYPYEIRDEVFDLNDKGQIVGNTIDPGSGRVVGYVATLPK